MLLVVTRTACSLIWYGNPCSPGTSPFLLETFSPQFDKEKADERVAALGGGIARIKVT